jgi:hypothetical protein
VQRHDENTRLNLAIAGERNAEAVRISYDMLRLETGKRGGQSFSFSAKSPSPVPQKGFCKSVLLLPEPLRPISRTFTRASWRASLQAAAAMLMMKSVAAGKWLMAERDPLHAGFAREVDPNALLLFPEHLECHVAFLCMIHHRQRITARNPLPCCRWAEKQRRRDITQLGQPALDVSPSGSKRFACSQGFWIRK